MLEKLFKVSNLNAHLSVMYYLKWFVNIMCSINCVKGIIHKT
jgi:hypothetical protein